MLIKAGTYRFNGVLSGFDNFAYTTSPSVSGVYRYGLVLPLSLGDGELVIDTLIFQKLDNYDVGTEILDGYMLLGASQSMSSEAVIYTTFSSNLLEVEEGWFISSYQNSTITEDTEVDDTFGTWFIDNTNYNEVNTPKKIIKAGTYKFKPPFDIAPLPENSNAYDFEFSSSLTDGEGVITAKCDTIGISKEDYFGIFVSVVEWVGSGETDEGFINQLPIGQINVYSTNPDYSKYNGWTQNVLIDGVLVSVMFETITTDKDQEVDADFYNWFTTYTEEVVVTKKITRLYLGETVYSSNGKRFRKLQTEEYVEPSLPDEDSIVGTWIFHNTISTPPIDECDEHYTITSQMGGCECYFYCNFESSYDEWENRQYHKIRYQDLQYNAERRGIELSYWSDGSGTIVYDFTTATWTNQQLRTIKIKSESSNQAFISWLNSNATKIA